MDPRAKGNVKTYVCVREKERREREREGISVYIALHARVGGKVARGESISSKLALALRAPRAHACAHGNADSEPR